jgi:small subunit ribosomal protein S20
VASHKSAVKAYGQSLARRDRNRQNRTRLRNTLKTARETVATGDAAAVSQAIPATASLVDKMVSKGIIHKNAAARYKSRLMKQAAAKSA